MKKRTAVACGESPRQIWNRHIKRFCNIWLVASNRSPKTIRAYHADLHQFCKNVGAKVAPSDLDRATMEGWVTKLQTDEYAPASIRRKLACLRVFFRYMVDQGDIPSSPMRDMYIRLGAGRRLTMTVSQDDLARIIRLADRRSTPSGMRGLSHLQSLGRIRDAILVRLMCATGIRVGELVAIRVVDVRAGEGALVIRGKGGHERLAFVADHTTKMLLHRYMVKREAVFSGREGLLTTLSGTPLSTDTVRHILRELAKVAGVSGRVTPHMLRHTAATALLENGADLRIVQEFLGHNSIRSTERYTHIANSHFVRVLRRANPLRRFVC